MIRDAVAPPPASPTSADQIQNIDQVKTAIKGYYGDMIDPHRLNPIDGTALHTFSPTGAYANEVGGIVDGAEIYLARPPAIRGSLNLNRKSVLFDVDDTTLNTYSYEIYTSFVYNPTSNAAFVNAGDVPRPCRTWSTSSTSPSRAGTRSSSSPAGPGRSGPRRSRNLVNEGYDVQSGNALPEGLCGRTPG